MLLAGRLRRLRMSLAGHARHRPDGWRAAAGAAAGVCAAVVALAALSGSLAGSPASAGQRTVVPVASPATAGGWQAENSGTRQRLYAVACLSARRCEAVGAAGTIIATGNGGRTWRPQASPLSGSSAALYAIACVAPSSCYVIARPNTILVTHNGGAAWSRHVLPVATGGSGLTDQDCLGTYAPISGRPALCRLGLLDIACASARTCYAVGTGPLGYDSDPLPKKHAAASSIWMTRDGGASWARQLIPAGLACDNDCNAGLYGYPLEWVSCLSSGLCRAGGGQFACSHCGFVYAVLATHGPGRPWTCAAPAATGACTSVSPDAGACPTSMRCYGPQTTSPVQNSINLLTSADGGANWEEAGPQQGWTDGVLNGIACPAAQTCYLAGSGGTIARITDGTTVTAQPTPTSRYLFGIACASQATCYAVGSHGTVLARR